MVARIIPQANEVYRCFCCKTEYVYSDAKKNWKCDICNNYLSIKMVINGHLQCCNRVKPADISVGDWIVLGDKHSHRVKGIRQEGGNYLIFLEEYGRKDAYSDSILVRIVGGWYD